MNILTTSSENWHEAISTFSEIFEVDPDDKTGYRVHAWHMLGLTHLSFAWIHIHLGANKVGPRDVITKEEIVNYNSRSIKYTPMNLTYFHRRFNEQYRNEKYLGQMFSISNISFPYEPFWEPCQEALFIAQQGLGMDPDLPIHVPY